MARARKGKLTEFRPQRRNANRHTQRGMKMLDDAIAEDGYVAPMTAAADGEVIDGSARLETVAERLRGADPIIIEHDGTRPIIAVRTDIPSADDPRAKRIALRANRVQQVDIDFDPEVLAELAREDADMLRRVWGDDDALAALLKQAGAEAGGGEDPGAQVDRAVELQAKWQVQPGDLWVLGEHRLVCGDCTDAAVVERLMQGEQATIAVTSPPYAEQRKEKYGGIPVSEYGDWFARVQAGVRFALLPNGCFFLNIKAHTLDGSVSLYVLDLVCAMVRAHSWILRDEFCWVHSGTPGDAEQMHKFKNCFEPIYWFAAGAECKFHPHAVMYESDGAVAVSPNNRGLDRVQGTKRNLMGGAVRGYGKVYPGNVLSLGKNRSIEDTAGHPGAYPVDLPAFFIMAYTDEDDRVYEPFSGSGTTIIACEQLSRRARAVEIAPAYCSVALERWSQLTGRTPERAT